MAIVSEIFAGHVLPVKYRFSEWGLKDLLFQLVPTPLRQRLGLGVESSEKSNWQLNDQRTMQELERIRESARLYTSSDRKLFDPLVLKAAIAVVEFQK